jgi:hypothetical protein
MSHHWQHISEADHMAMVRELAEARGWHLQYHTHDSRRSDPGWPDDVFARPPRIIFVEYKRENGQPSPEQAEWLEALKDCEQEAYLWRPSDQDEIDRVLR